MITSLGADEMEWRRLTREREREAGRKGRRIVYSNEGVNKWWAARRIDLGRATAPFDTALHPRVAIPALQLRADVDQLFSRLLLLSFSPYVSLSLSLSLQPVPLFYLSISVSLPGWPLLEV